MKRVLIVIGVVAGILATSFGFEYFGLGMVKFFKPKYEEARREVFEQTKSYVHGMTQELAKYYAEYDNAKTQQERDAIKALICMQYADFDDSAIMSNELRVFLTNMRGY